MGGVLLVCHRQGHIWKRLYQAVPLHERSIHLPIYFTRPSVCILQHNGYTSSLWTYRADSFLADGYIQDKDEGDETDNSLSFINRVRRP